MSKQNRVRSVAAVALLAVLALLGAAGCGSRTTPGPVAASGPSSQRPEGICPPPDSAAAAGATPCISVSPEIYQQSNHLFQQRLPASAALIAAAGPLQVRATRDLEQLTRAQRQRLSAVRSALIAAGLPAAGIYLQQGYGGRTAAGTSFNVVDFGAYARLHGPPLCVFGEAGPYRVEVNLGRIIADGGCLPGPGGH